MHISCISINCPPEGSSGSPSHGNSCYLSILCFTYYPPHVSPLHIIYSQAKSQTPTANPGHWSRFSSEKHHRRRENNWFVRERKRRSDGGVHWLLPRWSWTIVSQVRLMIRCEEVVVLFHPTSCCLHAPSHLCGCSSSCPSCPDCQVAHRSVSLSESAPF